MKGQSEIKLQVQRIVMHISRAGRTAGPVTLLRPIPKRWKTSEEVKQRTYVFQWLSLGSTWRAWCRGSELLSWTGSLVWPRSVLRSLLQAIRVEMGMEGLDLGVLELRIK